MAHDAHTDIVEGEVLWMGPDMCHIPELPDGFAFRVVDFLGCGGEDDRHVRLVWLRGPCSTREAYPTGFFNSAYRSTNPAPFA
jgi:hypothetical protein